MRRRAALALALAASSAACGDATLGGDTRTDAAIAKDSRTIDAPRPTDASLDARTCTGGNAAALAPDGSCLVHFTSPATYVNARAGCATLPNGHLAYLKDAALDTFAESFIGTVNTWIGGNDLGTENAFQWDDNTAFAFTAWFTGEPNNGGGGGYQEDCVIIAGARAGKMWDDRPCDATEVPTSGMFAYLCQY